MDEDIDLKYRLKKLEEINLTAMPENLQQLKKHLKSVKEQFSTRTRINHMMVLIPFTDWCKKLFTELTEEDLEDYFDKLEAVETEGRRKGKKKAVNTVSSHKKTIKTFLKKIDPELAATIRVKQIKCNKTPDSLLTEQDITKMINVAKARDKAFLACLWDTGARRAEILSTTIVDAKFDRYGCQLWLRESKTGARPARLVFASSYLRRWLDEHPRKDDPSAPIFCSSRAPYDLISRNALYNKLDFLANKAGVKKKVNPHNWRHTRATDLAKKLTEQEMKVVLGWTAGSRQTETYVHLSGMDINKAMFKAAGIVVDEEQEPSLLSAERCPRCKALNAKINDCCDTCGLPLSEKARMEEAEAEREAQAEHDNELIQTALKLFKEERRREEEEEEARRKVDMEFNPKGLSMDGDLKDVDICKTEEEEPDEATEIVKRVITKKET
jgi:integrase/recombinase XerD